MSHPFNRKIASITRAEFQEADRAVRSHGYKCAPVTFAEAVAFAVRYPDCVTKASPWPARALVKRDASADDVITGRGQSAKRHETGGGWWRPCWKSAAYFANFIPRASCSWRPTVPFMGARFERRPLP